MKMRNALRRRCDPRFVVGDLLSNRSRRLAEFRDRTTDVIESKARMFLIGIGDRESPVAVIGLVNQNKLITVQHRPPHILQRLDDVAVAGGE